MKTMMPSLTKMYLDNFFIPIRTNYGQYNILKNYPILIYNNVIRTEINPNY